MALSPLSKPEVDCAMLPLKACKPLKSLWMNKVLKCLEILNTLSAIIFSTLVFCHYNLATAEMIN